MIFWYKNKEKSHNKDENKIKRKWSEGNGNSCKFQYLFADLTNASFSDKSD